MAKSKTERKFDIIAIKSRRNDLAHFLENANQASTMAERQSWYLKAFAGWPTPLDDINQLIEQIEKMESEAAAMREYIKANSSDA